MSGGSPKEQLASLRKGLTRSLDRSGEQRISDCQNACTSVLHWINYSRYFPGGFVRPTSFAQGKPRPSARPVPQGLDQNAERRRGLPAAPGVESHWVACRARGWKLREGGRRSEDERLSGEIEAGDDREGEHAGCGRGGKGKRGLRDVWTPEEHGAPQRHRCNPDHQARHRKNEEFVGYYTLQDHGTDAHEWNQDDDPGYEHGDCRGRGGVGARRENRASQ